MQNGKTACRLLLRRKTYTRARTVQHNQDVPSITGLRCFARTIMDSLTFMKDHMLIGQARPLVALN